MAASSFLDKFYGSSTDRANLVLESDDYKIGFFDGFIGAIQRENNSPEYIHGWHNGSVASIHMSEIQK